MERDFLQGRVMKVQVFRLKESKFRLDIKKKFFSKGGETLETLEEAAQSSSKCSIPGNGWMEL